MKVHRIAAASVMLLAACLAGCGESTQLDAGESVAGPAGTGGETFDVRVPSGTIEIVVGEPTGEVSSGSRTVTAPGGGALVPVEWTLNRGQTTKVTGFNKSAEIALVTADAETVVTTIPDDPTPAIGRLVVAVPNEEPVDAILITYDGVEQRFGVDGSRDAGLAEGLYEPIASGESTDCRQGWTSQPTAQLDVVCQVRVWTVPYLPDQGWADSGSTHVIIEPDVTLRKVTANNAEYRPRFTSATVSVNGEEVDAPVTADSAAIISMSSRIVVASATTPLTWGIHAIGELRSRGERGPWDGDQVTLTGGGSIG